MKALGNFFASKLVLAAIGVIFLGLLIWFLGPLVSVAGVTPLEDTLVRVIAELVLLLVFVAAAMVLALRNRQRDATLAKDIAGSNTQGAAGGGASDAEVQELSNKLAEALALLKQTKFAGGAGKRFLYQLPWYVFIGPPGAGKTTALVNSGLSFPLAEKFGKGALRGVGGTRSCDWWFTDDAVLIDTAGRYTTQDSESEADKSAWLGFLRLLKQHRKRQPLNGVIVAIGVSDLIASTPEQRSQHAAAIRARVRELYTELGVRLPIYVLFTKADLLAGFVEFFDDLKREDREQVWGMTFELAKSQSKEGVVGAFKPEFDLLVGRTNDRLLERLQNETDIQRRALLFNFPSQLASLRDVAHTFLGEIFEPNRFEEPLLLRGVYLTSGTQDGTPIDRLMGAMASTFGISRQQISAFSGQGRSYFLTRLFKQVIFGEAGLVNTDPKVERRARNIRIAAYAAAAVLVLGFLGAWTLSYLNNSALIASVDREAASYNAKIRQIQPGAVSDASLAPILPLLDQLRDLPGGYAHRNDSVPVAYGFGLYQGDKLGAQAQAAYFRALDGILLPRMLLRLETLIATNIANPSFPLYQALKIYLMLGAQHALDKNLILAIDWAGEFPGPENDAARKSLAGHLEALLSRPLTPIPLNADLVDQARQVLARQSLADRAYALLKTDPRITALPEWRITDNAGPAATRVFIRRSGLPLTQGIPGLYTYNGYYHGFRIALPEITSMVAADSWVLGPYAKTASDASADDQLKRDVTSLYLHEFAAAWDQMLGDVAVRPFNDPTAAVETLSVLSAPDSPIKTLTVSAAHETWLSKPAAADMSAGGLAQAAGAAASGMQNRAESQLSGLLGGAAVPKGANIDQMVGQFTDTHFKALHDLAGAGTGPAPIDDVVKTLNDLYTAMTKVAAPAGGAAAGGGAGGGVDPTAKVIADNASRLPDPIKGWVATMAKASSNLAVSGARQQLNALYTANVLPFCTSATQGRYPIYVDGAAEVTLDDFGRLFGKGGLMDDFFTTNLRPFVDVSKNPWQWQKVNDANLGIPPAVLNQFQRAIGIRDSMFPNGGGKPGFSFEMVPVDLDPQATSVVVDIDGQTVTYDHGPPRPVRIAWPNPNGTGTVRVAFRPTGAISIEGPWSLMRLFDRGHLVSNGRPDRFTVTFTADGHRAVFEIRADSVVNPFASNQLERFRCPPSL